ncbi:MAG: hypothetical protein U0M39_00160 [Oscillospiraceae bacterium]|nr:hypothetical protein [Oscillospiraceae bacterium]
MGREKFGEGHYHCGGAANATINEALKPFYSFFAASLAALRRFSLYVAVSRKEKRLLGFQVQGHFVRQTKNALPSSFQKLSRAFCSLSDWKATCKPPVPFDGNEQLAEKSCYHFAIKSAVANQKVVISLGFFSPEYHNFFIPTQLSQWAWGSGQALRG